MAGHSQFKNIMYRKGAQDAKRAKMFTKLAREITVAAKEGLPDPDSNARLRAAISAARGANMPKDNIERAIKKGMPGGGDADYVEMRYEGYGPFGVALIVEALTDNRNRTAAEVRAAFNKYGGSLGETNSVAFGFERVGSIAFPASAGDADAVFEAALEAGASNVESDDGGHEVESDPADYTAVRDALEARFGAPERAALTWKPSTTVPLAEDQADTIMKLVAVLEDNDDVQSVAANFEIDDDVLARLTA